MRLLVLPAKVVLFLATVAFVVGMFFMVAGAYLASWPIMRVSPGNRRIQSVLGLAVALMAVARAYNLDKIPGHATGAPDDTEVTEGGEVDSHSLR